MRLEILCISVHSVILTAMCARGFFFFTETPTGYSVDETLFYYLQGGNGGSATTTSEHIFLVCMAESFLMARFVPKK